MPDPERRAKLTRSSSFTLSLSLIMSVLSLAYTFGILTQKVNMLDENMKAQATVINNAPAVLNELQNINRRLVTIEAKLDRK